MIELSEEQRMLVNALRDISESEFRENACSWGYDLPWENIEILAEQGFLGINLDEEYGGGGMTELEGLLMIEEVGRICPDTGEFLLTQQMVGPRAIQMFGSEAAKEQYLPPVVNGESYVAIAMSEPGGGSDLQSLSTTVEERGDQLVLNGHKTWVTDVPDADATVVWARFPEGLGSVIVDMDADGVEIGNHFTNMAGNPQSEFFLEDVVVPEENVLTRGGDGFKEQLKSLNWERLASAAEANAMAMCALEQALGYAEEREQFGQPIGEFQGIEWKIADMVKKLQTSRALVYKAAEHANARERVPDPLEAAIAKLYASEVADYVVDQALQIHGANGYQQGSEVEYLYRFARGYRIAGGTDEILKNTIASMVKKQGMSALMA